MMIRPKVALIGLLLFDLLLVACGGTTGAGLIRADVQRDTAPQVDPTDQSALASGNAAFAFDLYQQLRTQDGNLIYSPYSISVALAMTYAGANGSTAQQMADT